MNKDEILAKSRAENAGGDEREKKLRVHRDAFMAWGPILLGFAMMVIKLCKGQSPADIISMLFGMVAMAELYNAIQTRKKLHIILSIAYFLLTGYYFYRFCAGIF